MLRHKCFTSIYRYIDPSDHNFPQSKLKQLWGGKSWERWFSNAVFVIIIIIIIQWKNLIFIFIFLVFNPRDYKQSVSYHVEKCGRFYQFATDGKKCALCQKDDFKSYGRLLSHIEKEHKDIKVSKKWAVGILQWIKAKKFRFNDDILEIICIIFYKCYALFFWIAFLKNHCNKQNLSFFVYRKN